MKYGYDDQDAPAAREPRFNTMGVPLPFGDANPVSGKAPDEYESRTDAASTIPNTIDSLGNYVVTASGRKFSLSNPRAEDVNLHDIATALSRIPRFCGHTPHSVAQHSVLVKRLVEQDWPDAPPSLLLAALLHDAHEAYLGDMSTPVARELSRDTGNAWGRLKARVQRVIYEAVGLPWAPWQDGGWVKRADQRALLVERDRFVPRPLSGWGPSFPTRTNYRPDSYGTIAAVWSAKQARDEFLRHVEQLARHLYPRPNVPAALQEFVG